MSIRDELLRLEQDGRITRYKPEGPRKPQRRLYLAARAVAEHNDRTSAVNLLVGRGYVRAAFDRWSLCGRVYGNHTRGRFIVPLHPPPPNVWEIKITEPIAQARAFGRFPEPDTFIVTHLHTRRFLDENDAWRTAMEECDHIWQNMFPHRNPFIGQDIHDYITENCDDFPISTRPPKPRGKR